MSSAVSYPPMTSKLIQKHLVPKLGWERGKYQWERMLQSQGIQTEKVQLSHLKNVTCCLDEEHPKILMCMCFSRASEEVRCK